MKKKIKYPIIALVGIISFSVLIFVSFLDFTPDYRKNHDSAPYGTFPMEYYQDLNLSHTFVYNITAFGADTYWESFPNTNKGEKTLWGSSQGGQIRINFTGFYGVTDELEPYLNGGEVPYMDIDILSRQSPSLWTNFSISNISNIEASYNFQSGFNQFKSGFIIPFTNFSGLKEFALWAKDTTPECLGTLDIEETYNFIYIAFSQTNAQHPDSNLFTFMTYEKRSGLLIRLYTQCGDYKLEAFLNGYAFNINQEFKYNVLRFESSLNITNWHSNASYGVVKSNNGGKIRAEFLNEYPKSKEDSSVFDAPIQHLDAIFIENKSWEHYERGVLIEKGDVENISNTELANAMGVGYRDFDSGFLLPTNNLSRIKTLASQQNQSGGWEADIEVKETNLTIQFNFKKQDSTINVSLIYDKYTGLLQYASINTTNSPDIEFKIEYYDPLIAIENLTLIIEHWNGDIDIWANFSLVLGGTTVYDALIKWCEVSYRDYGNMGLLITGIDGDNGDWLYSINEGYVGAAANKVDVKSDDKIRWWII